MKVKWKMKRDIDTDYADWKPGDVVQLLRINCAFDAGMLANYRIKLGTHLTITRTEGRRPACHWIIHVEELGGRGIDAEGCIRVR